MRNGGGAVFARAARAEVQPDAGVTALDLGRVFQDVDKFGARVGIGGAKVIGISPRIARPNERGREAQGGGGFVARLLVLPAEQGIDRQGAVRLGIARIDLQRGLKIHGRGRVPAHVVEVDAAVDQSARAQLGRQPVACELRVLNQHFGHRADLDLGRLFVFALVIVLAQRGQPGLDAVDLVRVGRRHRQRAAQALEGLLHMLQMR